MSQTKKILLVDDEKDVLEFLKYNLEKEGYKVFCSNNGKDAIVVAKKEQPDLIVLDVMMPEMDGIETCSEIRKIDSLKNVLIIFLTARNEDYSHIAGYDAGADDYISKPIRPKVFVSKLQALLRRAHSSGVPEQIETVGGISIDRERYVVTQDGQEFSLPKKEFELLALLMSKQGRVFKRDEILNLIWGEDIIVGDRTVDVHISKLREKLGEKHIGTVKGVGYKFVDE